MFQIENKTYEMVYREDNCITVIVYTDDLEKKLI